MSQPNTLTPRKTGFQTLISFITDPAVALYSRGVAGAMNGDAGGSMRSFRTAIRHRAEVGARGDRLAGPAASNDDEYTPG